MAKRKLKKKIKKAFANQKQISKKNFNVLKKRINKNTKKFLFKAKSKPIKVSIQEPETAIKPIQKVSIQQLKQKAFKKKSN